MKAKSLLQQQAYDYIKGKILSGELVPNVLYSETKLSATVGISRTPMREALQCLSQDGYINIVPSKGFQLRQLNEKDMTESIQVRCAIEGFCTHTIADSIDTPKGKALLVALEDLLIQMRVHAQKADENHEALEEFISCDHRFHLKLVEYINNSEFEQLYQRHMYMIRLTSNDALTRHVGRLKGTIAEHEAYLVALKEHHGDEAYHILLNHLLMPIKIDHESSSAS